MSRFFLREAVLTVGSKQFNTRIAFEIKKNNESDPNKAKISLYNLSGDSRSYLEKTTDLMRLEAGYQGNLGIIFQGEISKKGIRNERKGGDIVTTLLCGDGQTALTDMHLEMSWKEGVTCQQIVDKAVKEIGLHMRIVNGNLSKQYIHGKAYSGTIRQLLDEITAYCGLKWSVQNNAIQVFPKDSAVTQNVFLISSESGMIGLPSKGEKGIIVRSLLNAQLIPDGFFRLVTKELTGTGTYRIVDVKHVGDTREGDWYTEVEGEVPGAA